jgi:hypothetical protein
LLNLAEINLFTYLDLLSIFCIFFGGLDVAFPLLMSPILYFWDLAIHLPISATHLPNLDTHLPNLATHLPNLAAHLYNLATRLPYLGTHLPD